MMTDIERKVDTFFASFGLRHYKKGQVLLYRGDPLPGIFYLVNGEVRQYDITDSGDEIVINVFTAGAFFPMMSALNHTPDTFFLETTKDAEIRLAPPDAVIQFLQDNPDVMYDLLQRVYRGMDGVLRKLRYAMRGSARSRIILELIIAAQRFGDKKRDGIALNMSESECATHVGLTRETVSRELHRLQGEGKIAIGYKKIFINDLAGLEKEVS